MTAAVTVWCSVMPLEQRRPKLAGCSRVAAHAGDAVAGRFDDHAAAHAAIAAGRPRRARRRRGRSHAGVSGRYHGPAAAAGAPAAASNWAASRWTTPSTTRTPMRGVQPLVGCGGTAVGQRDVPVVQRTGNAAGHDDALRQRPALVRAAVEQGEYRVVAGAEYRHRRVAGTLEAARTQRGGSRRRGIPRTRRHPPLRQSDAGEAIVIAPAARTGAGRRRHAQARSRDRARRRAANCSRSHRARAAVGVVDDARLAPSRCPRARRNARCAPGTSPPRGTAAGRRRRTRALPRASRP